MTRKRYGVFACYNCFQWQYCNLSQKTHTCVYCGKKLALIKVSPAFETDNADEAIRFIQEVKKRIGLRKGWGEMTRASDLL